MFVGIDRCVLLVGWACRFGGNLDAWQGIFGTFAVDDVAFEFDIADRKIIARGIQMQIALRGQPGTDTAVTDRSFVWQRNGRFFGRLDDIADIFLEIRQVFRLILIA